MVVVVVCCNSIISLVAAMPRQLSHQYHCGALYMTFCICLCVFVFVYLCNCLINIIAMLVWWIYVHHHLTQILFELLPKSSLYHLSSLYFLDLNLYLFLIVLCPNNLSNIKGAVILNLRRSFNFDIPNIFNMQTFTTTFTKWYFSII